MNPEEQVNVATEIPEVVDNSLGSLSTEEVPAFNPTVADVPSLEQDAVEVPQVDAADDGAVDLADLSDDVVADLADLPEEVDPDAGSEGSSEFGADAAAPETPEEPILPPPNLDEMFSEESIKKLRQAIESSPCYQRRLAAYKQQQEQLGKSIDISPSSSMISPLYKLQFFGSYVKGMLQLVQNNYLVLLLIGLLVINGILFYNYFTSVSDNKTQSKEEKLKKKMKAKAEKLDKEDI
ncbi:skeleton-binding protein 1, putative [Plasmodium vivax]|uniref:Skeleton-binding protein 1, putative n=1 Tax=Plasmodium vivax TaxID=5855 RepID=A0A564ZWH0_PLAVI|nr:skeleton-binding protein 1, putative [Plasmodium vivax]